MSRSFKHVPINWYRSSYKRTLANKKVRHFKGPISNGNAYRKIFDSWDVREDGSFCTWERY